MKKYNERVQALAEKFAKEKYGLSENVWRHRPESNKNIYVNSMLPIARIAVAEQAEAFVNGYKQLGYDECLKETPIPSTEQHLISQGYLPQNEGE